MPPLIKASWARQAGILVLLAWMLAAPGPAYKYKDGPVLDAPGETWAALDAALRLGMRGLARGASLEKLLRRARKKEPGRRGNQ